MERSLPFLVVEFPSEDFVITRFTRAHPPCVVDLISEPATLRGGDRIAPAVFLAKGVAWREFRALADDLARTHEPPKVLRRDAAGLSWLCRVNLHEASLGGDARGLARFQERFGPAWLHAEQGVLHLRAQLDAAMDGERLVRELTSFLEETGVQAQAEVLELGPHDQGVWKELHQAGAGLLPSLRPSPATSPGPARALP